MIKVQLNKGVTGNQFQIKFSGDGARVSKISNVVISSVAELTSIYAECHHISWTVRYMLRR
jgi:hypothetical protein